MAPVLFVVHNDGTSSLLLTCEASFSGSVIDTVFKIENLITVSVECHGDDIPLTFYDTPLFSLLMPLVHVNKFNIHDTLITLPLRLTLCKLFYLLGGT